MKIFSVGKSARNEYKPVIVQKEKGKEFSDSLQMAKRDQQEQELKEMLDKIKIAGNKLKVSKSVVDILEYKKYIKDYLSFVTNNYYEICQDRRYYSSLLLRVEVINKEIDELTQALLEEEKTNIVLADKIDKITGLLLDLFC